jgi:hypothetical protein
MRFTLYLLKMALHMKKHITLLVFTVFVGVSSLVAQIELDNFDYHRFGNQYFRGFINVNLSQIDIPTAGANQAWDYFLLQNDFKDTLAVVKVDETPFVDSFPNAEFALTSNFSKYFFESLSPEGARIEGFSNYDPITMQSRITRFDFAGYSMPYPLTFGDTYGFDYAYESYFGAQNSIIPVNADTGKVKSTVNIEINVDGFGVLAIPAGSFNALRFKQNSLQTDSVYVLNDSGFWELDQVVVDSTITYLFFSKNIGASLLTIATRSGEISSAYYLTGLVIDGVDEVSQGKLVVYPQPAGEFIYVNSIFQKEMIEIRDVQGRIVHRQNCENNLDAIDVSGLDNGVYFLLLRSPEFGIPLLRKIIIAR